MQFLPGPRELLTLSSERYDSESGETIWALSSLDASGGLRFSIPFRVRSSNTPPDVHYFPGSRVVALSSASTSRLEELPGTVVLVHLGARQVQRLPLRPTAGSASDPARGLLFVPCGRRLWLIDARTGQSRGFRQVSEEFGEDYPYHDSVVAGPKETLAFTLDKKLYVARPPAYAIQNLPLSLFEAGCHQTRVTAVDEQRGRIFVDNQHGQCFGEYYSLLFSVPLRPGRQRQLDADQVEPDLLPLGRETDTLYGFDVGYCFNCGPPVLRARDAATLGPLARIEVSGYGMPRPLGQDLDGTMLWTGIDEGVDVSLRLQRRNRRSLQLLQEVPLGSDTAHGPPAFGLDLAGRRLWLPGDVVGRDGLLAVDLDTFQEIPF